MDIQMKHKEAVDLFISLGEQGFINHFEEKYNFRFYTMSTYWVDNSKYICKLKGAKGDLIITWE